METWSHRPQSDNFHLCEFQVQRLQAQLQDNEPLLKEYDRILETVARKHY